MSTKFGYGNCKIERNAESGWVQIIEREGWGPVLLCTVVGVSSFVSLSFGDNL